MLGCISDRSQPTNPSQQKLTSADDPTVSSHQDPGGLPSGRDLHLRPPAALERATTRRLLQEGIPLPSSNSSETVIAGRAFPLDIGSLSSASAWDLRPSRGGQDQFRSAGREHLIVLPPLLGQHDYCLRGHHGPRWWTIAPLGALTTNVGDTPGDQ